MAGPTNTKEPEVVALLRQCKEQPSDTSARLVLADWVEEHARTPAERALAGVIRTLAPDPWWQRQPGSGAWLDRRIEKEGQHYGGDWLGPLIDQVGWAVEHGLFVIYALADTLAAGELEAPELPGGWEWVERVAVRQVRRNNLADFLQSPVLAQVTGLSLHSATLGGAAGAKKLASAPALSSLRALELPGCGLADAGVRALAASSHLGALRLLDLGSNGVGAGGLRALLDAPFTALLEILLLGQNPLDAKCLEMLANCPQLANLRVLGLAGGWGLGGPRHGSLPPEALQQLARSPHLARLELIDLSERIGRNTKTADVFRERWGDGVIFS